jgi:hypothetical protein
MQRVGACWPSAEADRHPIRRLLWRRCRRILGHVGSEVAPFYQQLPLQSPKAAAGPGRTRWRRVPRRARAAGRRQEAEGEAGPKSARAQAAVLRHLARGLRG